MISLKTGDIISEQADALVNTVNCVGVMGRGVALQFKKAFPDNFKSYKRACDQGKVVPGQMFIYETGQLCPRYIFNFPTKRHWRGKSRIEDIAAGMKSLTSEIKRRQISSIAIPPLGSGLGGLNWAEVLPVIRGYLQDLNGINITIFEPNEKLSNDAVSRSIEVPKMTAGRAALILLMDRYLSAGLDPFISLLEVQKLMYFLQNAGERLNLRFEKAHYGPYAPNLSHVLKHIEGHYIGGYGDGGDNPEKQLALISGAVEDAERFIEKHPKTKANIDKVFELVDGFETSYGLELLSSTHWLIAEDNPSSIDELVNLFSNWSTKKTRFKQSQINKAYKTLQELKWVTHFSEGEAIAV